MSATRASNPASVLKARDLESRAAAMRALDKFPAFQAQGVAYRSAGHLLLIANTEQIASIVTRLGSALVATALVIDHGEGQELPPSIKCFAGNLTRLEGYLGRFKAYLLDADGSEEIELAPLTGHPYFDAVLDLGDKPISKADLPPPGYFAPRSTDALEKALDQLVDLVGEFEKPRYVQVNSDLCAHSASGLLGCTRCLNVCPAWAIQPAGEKVAVDVHLCHGIGSCASACPSGAISYNYPDRKTLLNRVRTLLLEYRAAGGSGASVLIHDSASADQVNAALPSLPGRLLPLDLEEIGAAGLELWLTALAYGAEEVLILAGDQTPTSVLRVLDGEIDVAAALLAGMGSGTSALRRIAFDTLGKLPETVENSSRRPAQYAAMEDKREAIRMAVDHLYGQTSMRQMVAVLPDGAAFGAVSVTDGCTLCMACASVCPPSALQGGAESPQLKFLEQNCVQCGLCVKACPESVISLQPRYLFDSDQRRAPRILREDEAVCCIDCGKPFAPRSSITKLQQQLAGHRMFAGNGARRFELCDTCRVKDILRETGQA